MTQDNERILILRRDTRYAKRDDDEAALTKRVSRHGKTQGQRRATHKEQAEFFINSVCERGQFLEYLGRETSLRFLGGRTFVVSFPYFSILSKLDRCI